MPRRHGNNLELGFDPNGRPVSLSSDKRATHLYVCGSTGTGKSKFLEHLIRQDIKNWRPSKSGLLLIDPHGSVYDSLMEWMTYHPELKRPVVPIDLRSNEWIVAYNMLRDRPGADPSVIVSTFVQAIAHVWGQGGTDETPLFARWASNILRTLYEAKQTLVEAEYLTDHLASEIRQIFASKVGNRMMRKDWRDVDKMSALEFEKQVGSTINRLRRFLGTELIRLMFGQRDVSMDLGTAIEEGHIILVNLAPKGARVSDEDGALFATLILNDLWTAAKERGKGDSRNPPKPFYVYIDEFQNFVTPSIAQQLDQARGFGLHLTLAHQYPNQLLHSGAQGKAIYDSVMVNARSKVIFQVEGEENLRPLAHSLFMGVMDPDEVKLRIMSTKVMGHRKEIRRSTTKSSSESESSSDGSGKTLPTDENDSERLSEFSSSSRSGGKGFAETEMEVDAAVFGQELSSVQFRDLEEQAFRAMSAIFSQQQRSCLARLVGDRSPVSVQIPKVQGYGLNPERIRAHTNEFLHLLPYAISKGDAQSNLVSREGEIVATVRQAAEDREPKTARRRVS